MSQQPVIAVVGLGLLGGSICQTLTDLEFDAQIIGVSSPRSTQEALDIGIISQAYQYHEIGQVKVQADLILLCTPIQHIFSMMESLAQSSEPWKPGALVSDVGSTKLEICQKGWQLLGTDRFIGGHPMAGSEKNGLSARDNTLFESALWLLCPSEDQSDLVQGSLLEKVILTLGSRLHCVEAELHDQWLAQVSHLPQLLSSTLSSETFQSLPDSLSVAGPGFRDMSRLALSSYPMWESIFQTNSQQIIQSIQNYIEKLSQVKEIIQSGDWQSMDQLFDHASQGRQQVNIPQKGWSQNLIEVIVRVQDQKGMISKVVVPLTEAGLDIRDIQLLKIREGSGGTLSLSFSSIQQADQAVELLNQIGIQSQIRGII